MLVDLVINHLSTVITWEDTGQEYFGRAVQNLAAVFYADDGLPTCPQPDRLQEALEVMMGMFYKVGLRTNVDKTVGIVCQPCRNAGIQLEEAYTRHMTGKGLTYLERQMERVL